MKTDAFLVFKSSLEESLHLADGEVLSSADVLVQYYLSQADQQQLEQPQQEPVQTKKRGRPNKQPESVDQEPAPKRKRVSGRQQAKEEAKKLDALREEAKGLGIAIADDLPAKDLEELIKAYKEQPKESSQKRKRTRTNAKDQQGGI